MSMNEDNFETFMAAGVALHTNGRHQNALNYRLAALDASDGLVEQGRAMRDVAASLERGATMIRGSDYPSTSSEWAMNSVKVLEQAVDINERDAYRERGASRDWLGRIILKNAIIMEKSGNEIGFAYAMARENFEAALNEDFLVTRGSAIDQYRLNMLAAASTSFSLDGDTNTGRELAHQGVSNSKWAEQQLSIPDRLRPVTKVFLKNTGALAVAHAVENDNRHRALWIAKKIV